jgi:putative PIN family toxin of toxin-antitoxin system
VRTIKKITVDTNILISFFVFPSGVVREIISLVLKKRISIFISHDIIEEYSRVLRLKFGWPDSDIDENISLLKRMAEVTVPGAAINAVHADPTDNKVIECAVAAKADVIISGDSHLLNMKKYRSIPIMKPADLLRELL